MDDTTGHQLVFQTNPEFILTKQAEDYEWARNFWRKKLKDLKARAVYLEKT